MKIYWWLILGAIVISVAIVLLSKKKKKTNPPPKPVVKESRTELPVRRFIIVNEGSPFTLTDHQWRTDRASAKGRSSDGDPDFAPDLVVQLAMCVHAGVKPLAIGITSHPNGIALQVAKDIVKASGLDIPVVSGSASISAHNRTGERSELSDLIVAESKKGELEISAGSPLTDTAIALKSGANASNIKVFLTSGTSNENVGEGATKVVRDYLGARAVELPTQNLWLFLLKKGDSSTLPLDGKRLNDIQYIDALRSTNKAWDIAHTPSVIAANRDMNTFMSQFRDDWAIRWADCQHTAQLLGLPTNNIEHLLPMITRGLRLMRLYK